jgi:hypothetical protein
VLPASLLLQLSSTILRPNAHVKGLGTIAQNPCVSKSDPMDGKNELTMNGGR